MKPKHLPYEIDPKKNRRHYYETYWKLVGLDLLQKHFPGNKGETLLDFGCGRGEVLSLYGEKGYDVTGTDADEECVRLSSEQGKAVQLDIEDPLGQFGENSFDYVVCYHVMEHVPTPIETIDILSKIARKGVVIAVPNLKTLTHVFSREVHADRVNEGHLQSWDHAHLQSLAERHGNLELIEWGFDTTILPVFNRFAPILFGQKGAVWLETKLFTKIFPYHGLSVLGLFRPKS
ncbi:class I SAM-dependent methyltransferase [Haloferula sp.]|uniref:class I SAM-dependent methyltransferase n=1 Tax=Haloferula sp. TaxID=2497595 RepID=UPI00329E7557